MASGDGSARIRRLRFDTGATWLDLVATVGDAYGETPVERLYDLARLREWLGAECLLPRNNPGEDDLLRAHALREALRSLALATVRGNAWPAGDVARVNEFLRADVPLELQAEPAGPRVRPPATARESLGRVARQAAEHLTGPEAAMLGTCPDHDCGMLFLDPTGRRVWCAAEICGVRHRVREHRRRRRAAG
jgi:predicted RNA-binding Zn ribbon-like protein